MQVTIDGHVFDAEAARSPGGRILLWLHETFAGHEYEAPVIPGTQLHSLTLVGPRPLRLELGLRIVEATTNAAASAWHSLLSDLRADAPFRVATSWAEYPSCVIESSSVDEIAAWQRAGTICVSFDARIEIVAAATE